MTQIPQWLEYFFLKKKLDKNVFLILSRLVFHSAEVVKTMKYLQYLKNSAESFPM